MGCGKASSGSGRAAKSIGVLYLLALTGRLFSVELPSRHGLLVGQYGRSFSLNYRGRAASPLTVARPQRAHKAQPTGRLAVQANG